MESIIISGVERAFLADFMKKQAAEIDRLNEVIRKQKENFASASNCS